MFIGPKGHWPEGSLDRRTESRLNNRTFWLIFASVRTLQKKCRYQQKIRISSECRSDMGNDILIFYLWFYNLEYDDWQLPCFDYGHFKLLRLINKSCLKAIIHV